MCVMIGLNGDRHPGLDITQAKQSLNTIIVVDVCFFFLSHRECRLLV